MQRLGAVFVLIWVLQGGNAWADNFSGFYVTAGGAFQAMLGKDLSKIDVDGFSNTTSIDIGKDSVQAQFALGYLHQLSDKFSIGAEVGKQLGQGPTLNNIINSTTILTNDTISVARQWKINSGWWLALKPSVSLGKDSLAFIKLSKHWASGTFHDRDGLNCTDPVNATGCQTSGGQESFTANTNGTGIGVGLQTRLADKLFLMIEVERINYKQISRGIENPAIDFSNTDSLKPRAIKGTISIGYWF